MTLTPEDRQIIHGMLTRIEQTIDDANSRTLLPTQPAKAAETWQDAARRGHRNACMLAFAEGFMISAAVLSPRWMTR